MNAAALLGMLAMRHYGWSWFDPSIRGSVSKALGAAFALALMIAYYRAKPSRPLFYVILYGCFEELQTIICSVAYIHAPWTVPVWQSICSARLDFDLGAIGVMLLALTLHKVCQPVTAWSRRDERA